MATKMLAEICCFLKRSIQHESLLMFIPPPIRLLKIGRRAYYGAKLLEQTSIDIFRL